MRDLLGKFAPGFIVVIVAFYVLGANDYLLDDNGDIHLYKNLHWLYWLASFAICQTTGVGLQISGEWLGLHSRATLPEHVLIIFKPWPHPVKDCDTRQAKILANNEKLGKGVTAQRERYICLKEGSGNLALALIFVAAVTFSKESPAVALTLFIAAFIFWASHVVHAARQAIYEVGVLNEAGLIESDDVTKMLNNIPKILR